jgi:hypothetical protein
MTFDPNLLLTREELLTPRTPTELSHWVENKFRMFAAHPHAKEWVLLHRGLSKQFHEEVYPLSLLAKHLYAERSDIKCLPNLDNRDFDATIFDYSISPPSELKVEITYAVDGYNEHLRMKYFAENGYVNAIGKVSKSGTIHTGHKISVEDENENENEDEDFEPYLLEQSFSLIRSAVENKSIKPQRYGQGHILLVAFEHFGFLSEQDRFALKAYVEKHVLTLSLNFAALYVVELVGKTFVGFELTQIVDH